MAIITTLKRIGLTLLVVALALFIGIAIYCSPNPFAIRDPSNPRFKAENFRFQDYPKGCDMPEMKAVLAAMFPMGTDEAYVDGILLKRAGAYTRGIENGKKVYGRNGFTNLWGWRVVAVFDENGKTKELRCAGSVIGSTIY